MRDIKNWDYTFDMDNNGYGVLSSKARNFVFLGEAGSGKSELAVNLAFALKREGKSVSFFDLDMTKPLFRSRSLALPLTEEGINVFFEEQFADAPTQCGWLDVELRDKDKYCILDVGGDYIGSRAIGGYSHLMISDDVAIYYIINPYRPWSDNLEHIDGVLSQVLTEARIPISKVQFIINPYLGNETTTREIKEGYERVISSIGEYTTVVASMVPIELVDEVELPIPLLPIEKKIIYPW